MGDFIKQEEYKKTRKKILSEHPSLLLKNLFKMLTVNELNKMVVEEIEARQTIFLCACGMFVKNATTSSYNLLVNDIAGCGKDYVTGKTLSLFEPHLYLKRTRISPTVFTYWHNSKFEPNWTWNKKVLYLEDVSNAVMNSSVFKVMCSSGSYATIVKDQRAIDIKIKGKPVMIITSANAAPTPEMTRRFTILNLDSSVKQTKAIVKKHLEYAKNGKIPEILYDLSKALSNLIMVKVKIPYADKLQKHVPMDNVIMRTHILRFLDYIKASTALHQWQRKIDKDNFYIATEQDYEIARVAMVKTTSNQYMIPLTKDQRRILDVFDKLGDMWFTIPELETKITWMSERWLRTQLNRLVEYGLLAKDIQEEDNKKRLLIYSKVENIIPNLPKKIM